MSKLLLYSVLFSLIFTNAVSSQNTKPSQNAQFGDNLEKPLTKREKRFIDEVYGDYAKKLVYDSPQRTKQIKQILRHRVIISKHKNKDLSDLKRLSKVPLANSNNLSLQRDFNIRDFNPLKYEFDFFSSKKHAINYWIDNTQYVVTILPQF